MLCVVHRRLFEAAARRHGICRIALYFGLLHSTEKEPNGILNSFVVIIFETKVPVRSGPAPGELRSLKSFTSVRRR
jgi:hypothetical protein